MINKVILLGNVGKDPEVRYTSSGKTVANLSLATSRKYKNDSGEVIDETEWHRICAFGRLAELVQEYVTKGKQLFVEGRIKTTSYEKNGQTNYSTEIVADVIKFLGGGSERPVRHGRPQGPKGPQRKEMAENQSQLDEDIPF